MNWFSIKRPAQTRPKQKPQNITFPVGFVANFFFFCSSTHEDSKWVSSIRKYYSKVILSIVCIQEFLNGYILVVVDEFVDFYKSQFHENFGLIE